jgi:hypothetical protein
VAGATFEEMGIEGSPAIDSHGGGSKFEIDTSLGPWALTRTLSLRTFEKECM